MPTTLSAIQSGLRILREKGPRRMLRETFYYTNETAIRAVHTSTGRSDHGENIYERDWDVLVILDACRVDLMNEVADSGAYDFLPHGSVNTFQSLGSYSKEWMDNTFTSEYADEMANTIHVTGNPFTSQTLDSDDFHTLDEVWRHSWDDEAGVVLPRPLTDSAITHWRENDADRMIIHYMQPHIPFVNFDGVDSGDHGPSEWGNVNTDDPWYKVRDGELDRDTAWDAYRDNLEYALDDVELLLKNLDAEDVVLSADHGNCIGEYNLWGHPPKVAIDELREVPWVKTSANDTKSYEPTATQIDETDANEDEVNERLKSLGYL